MGGFSNQAQTSAVTTDSQMTRQQMDYKIAILFQVNRCLSAASTSPSQFADYNSTIYNFIWSVQALEALMYPYIDKKYKTIEKSIHGNQSQKVEEQKAIAMHKFAELMSLLHRKGLLLEVEAPERF